MQGMTHWWRKQALQKKFLLSFISLMLLALLMLSVLASRLLEQESTRAVQSEMKSGLEQTNLLAAQWLDSKKQQLRSLSHYLPAYSDDLINRQGLLSAGREASGYSLLYLGTSDGRFLQSLPSIEVPEGFDPRQRPWFIQAQEKNDLILTPIYTDALTGNLTATLAIPLEQDNEQTVGGDIYISMIVDELLKLKMRWSSQLLMFDDQHRILAHSDQALHQKNLIDVLPGYKIDDSSLQQVNFDGRQWLASSTHVAGTDWYFLLLVDAQEVQAAHTELLKQLVMLAVGVLLVGGVLVLWLTRALTSPLEHFQEQLKYISRTLDLSIRLETTDEAELGELATQTNSLLKRLSVAISGVLSSSSHLTETADNLAQTAGLVSRNTDRQQEVSQSMAAAVEQMSSSVAEITSTMEELSASSTQIADHSQSVVDVANLTLESSKKGADAMQHLQLRMADIHHDSENSLQEIVRLGSKSKEISKVMDLINNLADQTKLIAFNAALEASSAGESGKRFSVVASEIRRLADSVTDSTHEIEDRIQEIQDSINRLVITSEKGASSIQLGMQVSLETADDLNALVQAASKTSSAAQQISLSTRQQKTASSQVVIALRDIANASTHNAQSVRKITEISEEMVSISNDLGLLVGEFTVDEKN